ncbi:MAG: Crp/Fnr family transcriptional regulator [Desulfobacterales bacterium]|nr:Crp/Fnr family transcriptional regulator [Desulfobacterales bacterium]
MEIIQHLNAISLFNGLTKDQYNDLAMILTDQEFNRGQTIFNEGDDGVGFYVIVTGRVKIYKVSPDGKEQILHILGPGDPFAEVAVFSSNRYPAHAEALRKSRLLFFPKDSFLKLVRDTPSLSLNMLASMSMRLKRFSHMIEALSLKEVPGRLAAHILYLREKRQGAPEVELDMAKAQLASLLGTIPETLSRILAKMSKQELIRINGPKITILDPEGLAALAEGETRLS